MLLGNWRQSCAWHKAVLTNTSASYRSFRDPFPNSPYARTALRLQSQPKNVPLMQFNRLSKLRVTWTWVFARPSGAVAGLIGKGNECVRLDARPQAGQHQHFLKDEQPRACQSHARQEPIPRPRIAQDGRQHAQPRSHSQPLATLRHSHHSYGGVVCSLAAFVRWWPLIQRRRFVWRWPLVWWRRVQALIAR